MSLPATFPGLRLELRDAVALLRIDRPPLNLLDQAVRASLADAFLALDAEEAVRAIVLGPGEQHFCAGADMNEFAARRDAQVAERHGRNAHRMIRAVVNCRKPTIAAIEGACLGGGFEIALGCDWRIAGRDARIGLPEGRRGVFPGTGGVPLLVRQVGAAQAKRLLWDCTILDGAQAGGAGLVDAACAPGDAPAEALRLAADWAAASAPAVRACKRMADGIFRRAFEEHLAEEIGEYVRAFATDDAAEGVAAFRARREPAWRHR